MTLPQALNSLPWGWRPDGYGCVYVLALSNDSIKVGSTRNPSSRIRAHRHHFLDKMALDIDAVYFSSPHRNYVASEHRVHTLLGRRKNKKFAAAEIYRGLKLADAIDFVEGCNMVGVCQEDE